MNITNEQQYAADKVIEAALLLQHLMRNAQKVCVRTSVTVFTDAEGGPAVKARCYVREEQTLRDTRQGTQD